MNHRERVPSRHLAEHGQGVLAGADPGHDAAELRGRHIGIGEHQADDLISREATGAREAQAIQAKKPEVLVQPTDDLNERCVVQAVGVGAKVRVRHVADALQRENHGVHAPERFVEELATGHLAPEIEQVNKQLDGVELATLRGQQRRLDVDQADQIVELGDVPVAGRGQQRRIAEIGVHPRVDEVEPARLICDRVEPVRKPERHRQLAVLVIGGAFERVERGPLRGRRGPGDGVGPPRPFGGQQHGLRDRIIARDAGQDRLGGGRLQTDQGRQKDQVRSLLRADVRIQRVQLVDLGVLGAARGHGCEGASDRGDQRQGAGQGRSGRAMAHLIPPEKGGRSRAGMVGRVRAARDGPPGGSAAETDHTHATGVADAPRPCGLQSVPSPTLYRSGGRVKPRVQPPSGERA